MLTRRTCLAAIAAASALPRLAIAADSKYRGTTVHFLTERNASQLALSERLGAIAKEWGVTLNIRYITTDEIEKKVMIDFVGGATTWDLVYTGGIQRLSQWASRGVVLDISPIIKSVGDPKLLAWDDFTPAARRAVTYGEKRFGLTVATSEQAMVWRRDLFSHPAEMSAFQAKYGYALQVPETYKEALDVAAFFTRKPGETLAGAKLEGPFWGTVLAEKRGTYMWHTFENFVAAFGVDVYDPKTHAVGIASPAAQRAVETMKAFIPSMPPSYINMSSGEISEMFTSGQVAFVGEYFDRLLLNLSKPGGPVGLEKAGFSFFPTAEGNPKGAEHGARSGPPVVAIYAKSANAEAAYKLLEAALAAPSQLEMAHASGSYLPSRISVTQQIAKERPTLEYLLRLEQSDAATLTDADILPSPSINKAAEIVDVVTGALSEIMVGAPLLPRLQVAQTAVEGLLKSV